MERRHRFIPSLSDQLESRVVLSRTSEGLAVVVSGLSPRTRVINRQQQAFTAEVIQAFQSFTNDYDQARDDLLLIDPRPGQSEHGDDAGIRPLHHPARLFAFAAAHEHLYPVTARYGKGARPAVRAQAAHRIQDHRPTTSNSQGLSGQVTAAHDSSAKYVGADGVALHAEPG